MEHTEDRFTMLHQIPSPAFFVEDGVITAVNVPAQQRQIEEGCKIQPLICAGLEAYEQFHGGCLYLTLSVCGVHHGASVVSIGSSHLFKLEEEADQAELQSMALTAQILRTPLSSVMSTAQQLFPLTAENDDPKTQQKIAQINRGLYQMLRVVCNMSDAYRCACEAIPRTEIREIGALVQEQFDRTAPLMEHTGIQLSFTGLQERIYTLVDVQMLERAIGNILSNAIKFTPKGKTITATLKHRGRMLYLTVQDSGTGIPDGVAGSVFNRYRRAPGLEDNRFGLGLGMVMIRSAAAAHGGAVLLEEGEDFGLRLTMTIPIRQPSDPLVRSPMIHVDYAGDRDHLLLELSDILPWELYQID